MSGLIVHEWLEPRGGAERVVDAMLEAFPSSELFALWNDAPEKYRHARESWLARTPLRHHKAAALAFLPSTWRHVMPRRDDLDWVLVSSHLFAHHVNVRTRSGERVPKFVYAHTPARYIWEPGLDQRGRSPLVRAASALLKPIDRERAQEAVKIAANSEFVRERIQRTWNRDAQVIYPPVDIERIQTTSDWRAVVSGDERRVLEDCPPVFILGASRFVEYKRLDWVIRAGDIARVPVVIAGGGPEERHLRALATEVSIPVQFILNPSTEMLYALYQMAQVLVFPAIEDFGIMPVECMAVGTPVVTANTGGTTETVEDGVCGVHAQVMSDYGIASAIEDSFLLPEFDKIAKTQRFSKFAFEAGIKEWIRP